jgi:hypothetical protein
MVIMVKSLTYKNVEKSISHFARFSFVKGSGAYTEQLCTENIVREVTLKEYR